MPGKSCRGKRIRFLSLLLSSPNIPGVPQNAIYISPNYTTGRARFPPEICKNGVTADGRGGDSVHISFSYSKAPKAKLTAAPFAAKMYIWITASAVAARRR